MRPLDLIGQNERFVEESDPHYFEELSQGQQPYCLMLACSDSRVCPSVVTQAPLGTMFVHRNIANQVVEGDASFEAALWFALTRLKVGRLVVKGHTGCGGIAAAREGDAPPALEGWLKHIRAALPEDPEIDPDQLARLNVLEQVRRLKEHPVYKEHGQGVAIEGYLLHLRTGRLEHLVTEEPPAIKGGKKYAIEGERSEALSGVDAADAAPRGPDAGGTATAR
ncbi:MAG: carbonic anhydrase [Bacillota bacterium]